MLTYNEQCKLVRETMAEFPAIFGLRAWPGKAFRIGERSSYVDDNGVVMLYTEIRVSNETWESFAKGAPDELRANITKLPEEAP